MAQIYLGDSIRRVLEANRWAAALGSSRRYQLALQQPGAGAASLAVEVYRLERQLAQVPAADVRAPGAAQGWEGAAVEEQEQELELAAVPLQRLGLPGFNRLHGRLRGRVEQQRR
jgi:hypothetical protein